MDRQEVLERLAKEKFDLLVVGGGSTGAGIALEAAVRGLKVALVERSDFASGTSSRSTKIFHGGVRYLEQAVKKLDRSQLKLVKSALRERGLLLDLAPHLAHPLPLLIPLYHSWEIPYYFLGMKLYDGLAGRFNLKPSRYLTASQALVHCPTLQRNGLRGAILYYEGQFDDARWNVALALTAAAHGACVANYAEVVALLKDHQRISGVAIKDRLTGKSFEVRAQVVVNATGPYADEMRRLDDPGVAPMLMLSAGTHIVLERKFCPSDWGILVPRTDDKRVAFILPWMGRTLVGTTDIRAEATDSPVPTAEEIDFLIAQARRYLAEKPALKDVRAAWCGLRPLLRGDGSASSTAALVREHAIETSASGLTTVAGGKWTTYREMAQEAVDYCIRYHGLKAPLSAAAGGLVHLVGAEREIFALAEELAREFGLELSTAQHLSRSYGGLARRVAELAANGLNRKLVPGFPYIEAEVVWAVREEMACTVVDFLARRLRLAFIDREAALSAVKGVAALMAKELSWEEARVSDEIAAAERRIATGAL